MITGIPQAINADVAPQLKAVQQFLSGESPSINQRRVARSDDLSQDEVQWIAWWSPSTPVFVYPLMRAGVSIAASLRLLTLLCLAVGSVGWVLWAALFRLRPAVLLGLAVLLPFIHYALLPLFLFWTETFVWAAVPWTLLLTSRAGATGSRLHAVAAGLGLGSLYVLKYSAVFVTLGGVAYLFARGRGHRRFVAAAGATLPVLALTLLNHHYAGASNLITASFHLNVNWHMALFAIANPALALADAEAIWRYVFLHPSRPIFSSDLILGIIGLPGGFWLIHLVRKSEGEDVPEALATTVLASGMAGLALCWIISNGVSFEARHIAGPSLAILPLIIRRVDRQRSWLNLLMMAFFIILPLCYGVISFGGKTTWRRSARFHTGGSGYRPGPSGLYNPVLAEHDIRQVSSFLRRVFDPATDIWYFADPSASLDLPGRAIIHQADFLDIQILRQHRYASRRPLRVLALLPWYFEVNGKGPVIRSSFPQVTAWQKISISGSTCNLWIGGLEVAGLAPGSH